MNTRFCEKCSADVEDVGGFCLLGHPLRLDPLIPSVAQVRHEVDRIFDEVRDQRSVREEGGEGVSSSMEDTPGQPPPPPGRVGRGRRSLFDSLSDDPAAETHDPIEAFAPPPRMDWGPSERRNMLQRTLRRGQGLAQA